MSAATFDYRAVLKSDRIDIVKLSTGQVVASINKDGSLFTNLTVVGPITTEGINNGVVFKYSPTSTAQISSTSTNGMTHDATAGHLFVGDTTMEGQTAIYGVTFSLSDTVPQLSLRKGTLAVPTANKMDFSVDAVGNGTVDCSGGVFNFSSGTAVKILNNTPSTSPTTGALVVTGGLGINGTASVADLLCSKQFRFSMMKSATVAVTGTCTLATYGTYWSVYGIPNTTVGGVAGIRRLPVRYDATVAVVPYVVVLPENVTSGSIVHLIANAVCNTPLAAQTTHELNYTLNPVTAWAPQMVTFTGLTWSPTAAGLFMGMSMQRDPAHANDDLDAKLDILDFGVLMTVTGIGN